MSYQKRIKEARIKLGLTQEALAYKLGIGTSTLNGYEKGNREPSVNMLSKIMNELDIDPNYLFQDEMSNDIYDKFSLYEQNIIKRYRLLDNYGKAAVDNLLEVEYSRCNVVEEPMPAYLPKTYYSISASAGNGEMLFDDLEQSTIMVPQTSESERADFVLQVNGDSMLPDFKDGDKVLVKKQDSIEIGEIGIFIVNCESFIKKLGQSELISLNKKYKPIPLRESDSVSCVGKVIGKV